MNDKVPQCSIDPHTLWDEDAIRNPKLIVPTGTAIGPDAPREVTNIHNCPLKNVAFLVTDEERQRSKEEKETMKEEQIMQIQAKRVDDKNEEERKRMRSQYSRCTRHGYCTRHFRSKTALDRHLTVVPHECDAGGNPFRKRQKRVTDPDILCDINSSLKIVLDVSKQINDNEIDNDDHQDIDIGASKIKTGFANRFNVSHPPILQSIKAHLDWMFRYGKQNDKKFNPREMQKALEMAGSEDLALQYPSGIFYEDFLETRGELLYNSIIIPELWQISQYINANVTKEKTNAKEKARPVLNEAVFRNRMRAFIGTAELEHSLGEAGYTIMGFIDHCCAERIGLDNPHANKVLIKHLSFLGTNKDLRQRVITNVFKKLDDEVDFENEIEILNAAYDEVTHNENQIEQAAAPVEELVLHLPTKIFKSNKR